MRPLTIFEKIMTREELFEMLPVLEAMKKGKTIQYRIFENGPWEDVTEAHSIDIDSYEYRVKPEPKYRPFVDAEECWNEMQKHQPFGWVKGNEDSYLLIQSVFGKDEDGDSFRIAGRYYSYEEALGGLKFADGTPFGTNEGGEE